MNGIVLAGTRSGVGKTVATLATMRALESAGDTVQPAKAGPDFIDPSHHERVAGRPSRTLDCWLEGEQGLRRNYHRGTGDICLVEGVMGLYDGDCSSTAMVAEALDLPVVLVVDATAGMESVAATALGFQAYADHAERDIDIVGVIAQRAHGGRHETGVRDALPESLSYFGRIPPSTELEIPDQHLGLEMGDSAALSMDALDEASEHLEVTQLRDCARPPPRPDDGAQIRRRVDSSEGRIAVARDAAFCFAYPRTLEFLRTRATVVTFAPVQGDDLPSCDAVYLPGGYPELHGDALEASPALEQLGARAADGLPVLGECGGLLALSQTLETTDGTTHEMAAVLPAEITMQERYQALDHVELEARTDSLTANSTERLRGHEFHYSSADVPTDAQFAFDVERGDGIEENRDGLCEYRTLGTYCHVHPESGAFGTFLEEIGDG